MLRYILFLLLIVFSSLSLASTSTTVSNSNGSIKKPFALLSWDKNSFAKKYHIQISTDKGFENILFQYKTKKNKYKYILNRPGTFYWHVRYYDKKSKKYSDFSKIGVINVTFENPYSTANDIIYVKNNKKPFFKLSWEVQRNIKNSFYILETFTNENFSDPKTYQLKKKQKKITVTPGKNILYWKVAKSSAETSQKINFSPLYKQIVFLENKKNNPSMNLFYSYSKGNYQEKEQELLIKNVQKSPLTIGTNLNYKFKSFKRLSLSSSFYISSFESLYDETSTREVFIPPEIGLTGYINYNLEKLNFDFYLGTDYEAISGYNISTLYQDKALQVIPHQLLYITTGMFKLFKIKNHFFFLKISYSLAIIDNTKGQNYSGSKYLIYLNYKIFKKVSFHTFYKHHSLHSISELSIDRIGVGINFKVW